MADTLKELLDAWGVKHGLSFVWRPDAEITYTRSRGAWHTKTADDDWISVHPGPPIEVELVVAAGHVEVERLTLDELRDRLEGVLAWFDGWNGFFHEGPGQGH